MATIYVSDRRRYHNRGRSNLRLRRRHPFSGPCFSWQRRSWNYGNDVNTPRLLHQHSSPSTCHNDPVVCIGCAMCAASLLHRHCFTRMTGPPLSYSAALGQSSSSTPGQTPSSTQSTAKAPFAQPGEHKEQQRTRRRSPSPSHVPRTGSEEENTYVLTLLTDKAHHARMTDLRNKYFPKRLNKLAAHLTLFHALPGSRLESDILPVIQEVASQTQRFEVLADKPFRLKKGIAISVSAQKGGALGKKVHRALQDPWKTGGFLSDQDAGDCRLHYTLMNKVDDETEVTKAYQEVVQYWRPDSGTAEGLALWKYDRGFWRWETKFDFQ